MGTTEPAGSRRWLIIAVAVVVVCCLCAVVGGLGWFLYTNGDSLFGLTVRAASILA